MAQSCLTLSPHGLSSARLLCPWGSSGKNTGASCHFLLQEIFPTQGSNQGFLCLLHCQADFFNHWATWEALSIKELKTEALQCFFKYLFQLHKISTFSLARSTFSFFCWSIFSSAAFLVFLPQSFLCFCLSVVCRHSPPALALPSYHFPSSHFKKNNFVHWLFSMFPSYFAFPWATGTIRVEVPRQHGKVTVLPGVDRACATRSGYTM